MPPLRKQKKLLFTAVFLAFVIALGGCSLGATRAVTQLQATGAPGDEVIMATRAPVPRESMKQELAWDRTDSSEEPEEIPQASDGASPSAPIPVGLLRFDRKVIKNAELTLRVNDTFASVDKLTGIVADYDGFIVSSRAWSEGQYRMATVTISVPVDTFEQVLRRLRGIAVEVLDERADGEDVTDQYVDLESRLRNLEATQTRIRAFLDQTVTVEEALEVNRRLSEVEAQIEDIKGKMNYLTERAAYSTITVHLQPERPTPTPTPTPTLPAWKPLETATEAGSTLMVILRFLADLAIWLAIVLLPFLIPAALILWAIFRWSKRSEP
jgi:uncharacterized coiled-coil protein SlyX